MQTFNLKEITGSMWVINLEDGNFYEVGEILPHFVQLKQIVLTDDLQAYYTGRVLFVTSGKRLVCID